MGAEAKRYLQEHSIPQLFEGLMTGLIYNRPNDPIQFLESAIAKVKANPGMAVKWDSFVDPEASRTESNKEKAGIRQRAGTGPSGGGASKGQQRTTTEADQAKARITTAASAGSAKPSRDSSHPTRSPYHQQNGIRSRHNSHSVEKASSSSTSNSRPNSLAQAANNAFIPPDAPIILFMGGPGGGKTRYAAQLEEQLKAEGLVHICMPDLVRTAIARYKDRLPEWRLASERYQRGELIPNELAQQLVKAEMGRHPNARAYFLEGFPREARQVEDFEKNVRPVDMALILDYDEEVLRKHMQSRGLLPEVIDRRINEFKQKTLPSAKYFDDQRLLHLIPGEKDDAVIIERMKKLALRAIRSGVQGGNGANPNRNGNGGGASTSTSSSTGEKTGMASAGREKKSAKNRPTETAVVEAAEEQQTVNETNSIGEHHATQEKPVAMDGPRVGTAGSGRASKPSTAGTAKSQPPAADSATSTTIEGRESATATMPQRTTSGSAKRIGVNSATNGSAAGQEKKASSNSREGSAKSQQIPSTVSTPKPSEGPFRELLANSANTGKAPAVNSNPLQNDNDPFPKGLPSEAPVILIIGAPGSNKSKFAQKVARKYEGFVYLSMGELFRRKVLQNSEDELWTRIGKKMDAGETIPAKICRELLYTALHERGQNSWGYVIEGYPRTLPQAEDIEAQLGRLDLAILIDCTEQFCRDALRRRYQKDKEEGAERADDDEGVVRVRLNLFKQNTLPMLKHLDDKGLLRVVRFEPADVETPKQIEGDSNEEKVFQEICTIIDNTIFIQDDGNGKSLGSSKQNSVDEAEPTQPQQA